MMADELREPPDRSWIEFEYEWISDGPPVGSILIGTIGICLGVLAIILLIGML